MNTSRPDNWRTQVFVGAIIGVAIVATAFVLTGPSWGMFCLALATFEGWTLINNYREDTISEVIWGFARRPMVPHIFGIAFGIAAGTGYLGNVQEVCRAFAIGFLFGHFFFNKYEERAS